MAVFDSRVSQADTISVGRESTPFISPAAGAVDVSAGNQIRNLQTAVEGGFDIFSTVRKKEFENTLGDSEDSVNAFNLENQRLKDELLKSSTAGDRQKVADLSTKIIRLQNNTKDNLLSPTEAKIRTQKLLKQAISDSPWLAPELKEIANISLLGVGAASGGKGDAIQAGIDSLVKESITTGKSPEAVLALAQMRDRVEIGEAAGKQNASTIIANANSVSYIAASALESAMAKQFQSNESEFLSSDWISQIAMTKREVVRQTNIELANLESQQKIILDVKSRDRIFRQLDDNFRTFEEIAKSKDRGLRMRELVDYNKNKSIEQLSRAAPTLSMLFQLGVSNANDIYSKMVKNQKLLGDGRLQQLKLLVEGGEGTTASSLALISTAIQNNKEDDPSGSMLQNIKLLLDPSINVSALSSDDRKELNVTSGTLISSMLPSSIKTPEGKELYTRSADLLIDSVGDPMDMAWFNNAGTLSNMQAMPELRSRVGNAMQNKAIALSKQKKGTGPVSTLKGVWNYDPNRRVFYKVTDSEADGNDIQAGIINIDTFIKTGKDNTLTSSASPRSPKIDSTSAGLSLLIQTMGNYGKDPSGLIAQILAELNKEE